MASTEKDAQLILQAKELEHVPWCEDYENMISGVLYDSMTPELVQARFRARRLVNRYNSHFPADATPESLDADRAAMLRDMLGRVGNGTFVEPPLFIDYGCNIVVGQHFYANFNLTILDCSLVTIGHRVMFGPNVSILAATHETSVESRRRGVEYARPVSIGDDCWVGAGVSILAGVSIGRGCTVGAGSVVTRHVPEFSVVVGVPARVVGSVEPVPDHVVREDGDGRAGSG